MVYAKTVNQEKHFLWRPRKRRDYSDGPSAGTAYFAADSPHAPTRSASQAGDRRRVSEGDSPNSCL
jgi:hypothetical protein